MATLILHREMRSYSDLAKLFFLLLLLLLLLSGAFRDQGGQVVLMSRKSFPCISKCGSPETQVSGLRCGGGRSHSARDEGADERKNHRIVSLE